MRCTAPGRLIQQAHGGFYRNFDSREHLVAEAAQRALSQGQRMDDHGRVVIRWISDIADPRQNDNSHRIASWHATVPLRHLRPAQAAGAVTDASHSIAVTGKFNAHHARARLSCHQEPIRAAQCQLQVPRTTVR